MFVGKFSHFAERMCSALECETGSQLLPQWIETMSGVRQLPRIAMAWGLMLLTAVMGGVRPTCICPDGSLCFVCPKQLDVHARSSKVTASAVGSCGTTCGCKHTETVPPPESEAGLERAGRCNGYNCIEIAPATPATVRPVEDPADSFWGTGVFLFLASFELPKQFDPREGLTPEFHWRPSLDFSPHLTVIATTVIRC